MIVNQLSPLGFDEGRQQIFSQLIGEVEIIRTRIQETIRDSENRLKGLHACDRLINRYQVAIGDWSQSSQQELSIAEELYVETKESLFSESNP